MSEARRNHMKKIFNRYLIDENGVIESLITKGKIMSPFYDRDGYKRVSLVTDEGRKKFRVCRLVAIAYIENPENKPFVNHIDGNKQNDNVNNLEWVTASENTKHALETGLDTRKRWTYKVFKGDKLIGVGKTYVECTKIIGCGKSTVSDAVNKGIPPFGKYRIEQTYDYD